MIRRPPRSTRTDTLFPTRRSSDLGVAISNEVPADAPCLVAQPRRLRQILLNLMTNSVKFSPPGTTVSVRLDIDDEGLCLQIIDRGRGMEPKEEIGRGSCRERVCQYV